MHFAHFDCAPMLQMGMIESSLHGMMIVVSRDHVVAAQDFFGAAVRAIANFLATHQLTSVFRQPMAGAEETVLPRLLAPGNILLYYVLHLFGAKFTPAGGIVVQEQHVI